jgi:hypothetical protein
MRLQYVLLELIFLKTFIQGVGRLIFVQQFYRRVINTGDKFIAGVIVTGD